jgi:hypothetical protein
MSDWINNIFDKRDQKKAEQASADQRKSRIYGNAPNRFEELKQAVQALIIKINQNQRNTARSKFEHKDNILNSDTFYVIQESRPVLRMQVTLEMDNEGVFYYLDSLDSKGNKWERRANGRIGIDLDNTGWVVFKSKYGDSVEGAAREIVESVLTFDL